MNGMAVRKASGSGDVPMFAVHIRIKNNRIAKAIERLGYASQAEACAALGISYPQMSAYATFRHSPVSAATGQWTETARKFAGALYADPEDLWPKEALLLRKATASFEATHQQLIHLQGDDGNPERRLLRMSDSKLLLESMKELSPIEKTVLDCRFKDDLTLDETGERVAAKLKMGSSREYVRQVQHRALRKLRSAILKSDLSDDVQKRRVQAVEAALEKMNIENEPAPEEVLPKQESEWSKIGWAKVYQLLAAVGLPGVAIYASHQLHNFLEDEGVKGAHERNAERLRMWSDVVGVAVEPDDFVVDLAKVWSGVKSR
jgi:hypothetical protein